jgi:uncharacterized membrane protein
MKRKAKNEKEECGGRKHTTVEALPLMMYLVIHLAMFAYYSMFLAKNVSFMFSVLLSVICIVQTLYSQLSVSCISEDDNVMT